LDVGALPITRAIVSPFFSTSKTKYSIAVTPNPPRTEQNQTAKDALFRRLPEKNTEWRRILGRPREAVLRASSLYARTAAKKKAGEKTSEAVFLLTEIALARTLTPIAKNGNAFFVWESSIGHQCC
jgi:hypothetical protein